MSPTNHAPGRNWNMNGLSDRPETRGTSYSFYVGPLDYYLDKGKIYLHIPEIACRDAEGRPAWPEQANWIDRILADRKIGAKPIWYSHWEFEDAGESEKFESLLAELDATEEKEGSWSLTV